MRSKTKNSNGEELARKFNAVVNKTIAKHKINPTITQLYKLLEALREDRYEFAATVIEQAIGHSEHVTPSTYITGGLMVLGLYKCELLPSPSQIQVLDRHYHGIKTQ